MDALGVVRTHVYAGTHESFPKDHEEKVNARRRGTRETSYCIPRARELYIYKKDAASR